MMKKDQLTKEQLGNMLLHSNLLLHEKVAIIDTIESGGFAPSEPTRYELRDAIARARGWNKQNYGGVVGWYATTGREVHRFADYHPDEFLGQALEAAAALLTAHAKYYGHVQRLMSDVLNGKTTSAEAAYGICRYLYSHIQEEKK